MTLPTPKNRVGLTIDTGGGGTGNLVVSATPESGYQALAGGDDGKYFDLVIVDGTAWEVDRECQWTNSSRTFTRGSGNREDSSTGGLLNVSVGAKVYVTQTAKRITDAVNLAGVFGMAEISVTGATTATIGHMHLCSGTTSDYEVALPAASGNAGKLLGFRMSGALTKLVTLNANGTETIDGALTRVMWANETAVLLCDGSNWFKIAGKSLPMLGGLYLNTNMTNFAQSAETLVTLDTSGIDNTGMMVQTGSNQLTIKRTGNYLLSQAVAMFNGSGSAGDAYSSVKTGSTYLVSAFNETTASRYSLLTGSRPRTMTTGEILKLYAYQTASATSVTIENAQGKTYITATEVVAW